MSLDKKHGHDSSKSPSTLAPRAVAVQGLTETLADVRHELHLIGHASKFDWINKRLILLRNAVIAFGVLIAAIVVVVICAREAYRQTLTIATFEVPEKLSANGVTGRVISKALFDELVKRRKTITTLDAGDLKGAWGEHRSDVALPETSLTFQSVFRYLRYLTGNEVSIDGEVILEGEDVLIKARVAGSPAKTVKGKAEEWQGLMGELANYVFETSQPAVLASYLGITAKTPEDLKQLSAFVRRMNQREPRPSNSMLAVAYDAYGAALMWQDRMKEGLAALDTALALDPDYGIAVLNAADAQFRQANYAVSDALYRRATKLSIGKVAKRAALRRMFVSASNNADCAKMAEVWQDIRTSFPKDLMLFREIEATRLIACDYEEAKGIAISTSVAELHPETRESWMLLGDNQLRRPHGRYLKESIAASRQSIALDPTAGFYAPFNLAEALAGLGELGQAEEAYRLGMNVLKTETNTSLKVLVILQEARGEYAAAEETYRRLSANLGTLAPVLTLGHARVMGKSGKTKEAEAILREGLTRFPKYCDLYEELGLQLARQNRTVEAFGIFDRGIAAVEKCGLNYIAYARTLIAQKRDAEARAKLQALIKIAPTSDGADEARELLAQIAPKT